MTTTNWFPRTHAGLYNKCLQTVTYLNAHLVALGIEGKAADWLSDSFDPIWQALSTAFLAWQDPSQRTTQKIAALNEAELLFKPLYRELYAFLKGNPVVKDDDLVAMGFPARSTSRPTPVPMPTSHPRANIDIGTLRQLTVNFVDSVTGRRGKPKGVGGAVVRWGILNEPPTDVEMLKSTILDTKTPIVLKFNESDRQKTAYICLAWQNMRGEMGPWSKITSAVIP